MIGLAPNDSLGAVLQIASNMTVMTFGEAVPAGGGAPQPYYNVATLTSNSAWVTIANSAMQLLINQVVIINNSGAANGVAVAIFPQTPGPWVAGGVNVGGGTGGYQTIPGYGMAVYSRGGWRVQNQDGSPYVQPPQWISLAPYMQSASGATWADYGGVWTAQASKDQFGWVRMRGLVRMTAGGYTYGAGAALILFMPGGWRPPAGTNIMFACAHTDNTNNHSINRVDIRPEGDPGGWPGGMIIQEPIVGNNNGICSWMNISQIAYSTLS